MQTSDDGCSDVSPAPPRPDFTVSLDSMLKSGQCRAKSSFPDGGVNIM